MHLAETDEQQALRKELRAYFADLLTDEIRASLSKLGEDAQTFRSVVRQIGSDGWLGLGWPTEYGGRGLSLAQQVIFYEE